MNDSVVTIPLLRWGRVYESLDSVELVDFETGRPVARLSQANAALVQRDLRRAASARAALRAIDPEELLARMAQAADLFQTAALPLGPSGSVTLDPDAFVTLQSATTGLPERLCRANMEKISFVLRHMGEILSSLGLGIDLRWLWRGYGSLPDGPVVSYQLQSPVLGAVLPNNSPGVHTLWLPALALGAAVALKPGTQEPWTPYRVAAALVAAGVPETVFGLYPGGTDVAQSILSHCPRAMVFGGAATVERYRSNPGIQVHGPGFSKILLGEDAVDHWEEYVELMVDSVVANAGRSCINCSSIWVPRQGKEIAEALAERLASIVPRDRRDPDARLAAFTNAEVARQIDALIEDGLRQGAKDVTVAYRNQSRLDDRGTHAYLLPTVIYCPSAELKLANQEFMFPFVSIVECPQQEMLERIGPTLVCTAITDDDQFRQQLLDCTAIDRLNLGPIPTHRVDWRQPHEGNLIAFLYKHRALQLAESTEKSLTI